MQEEDEKKKTNMNWPWGKLEMAIGKFID